WPECDSSSAATAAIRGNLFAFIGQVFFLFLLGGLGDAVERSGNTTDFDCTCSGVTYSSNYAGQTHRRSPVQLRFHSVILFTADFLHRSPCSPAAPQYLLPAAPNLLPTDTSRPRHDGTSGPDIHTSPAPRSRPGRRERRFSQTQDGWSAWPFAPLL